MRKSSTPQPDIWNEDVKEEPSLTQDEVEASVQPEPDTVEDLKPQRPKRKYSTAGLKEDFPTARELEQFIFDQTQVSLNLKGIDPDEKYAVALAVLNGEDIDPDYITGSNPYLDAKDLIPEDPMQPIPSRDPRLPKEDPVNIFHDMGVPHPDRDMRAMDAKVTVMFKTYRDGSISYEILGPLEKHAVGEKLDKYGRTRPEKLTWIDPRTGEQGLRYADGTYSRMGQRLRTLMESKRVNRDQSVWSIWIDRSFTQFNRDALDNPWLE